MPRYEVTFPGNARTTFGSGPVVQFRMGYQAYVDAPDIPAAITAAKEKAAAGGFKANAVGRPDVNRVYRYAITLRGRDKRRRETFIVSGTSLKRALARMPGEAVYRFAGLPSSYLKETDPRIVKVEELT